MTNKQLKRLKEINQRYKINSKNALSKERTDLVDLAIKEIVLCPSCDLELCQFCMNSHDCNEQNFD